MRSLLAIPCVVLGVLGSVANASQVVASITDQTGQPLSDAVIYVATSSTTPPPASSKHAIIDQIDRAFVPGISVVRTGTAIDFPNRDNIRHQVYSFSSAKTFTLKLYSGRPSEPVIFDKPGVVVLGCNIHDLMVAWLLVVDTPWFARTDAKGSATIAELPAGNYQLAVWHPRISAPVLLDAVILDGKSNAQRSVRLTLGPLLGSSDAPVQSAGS